jgi:hypothetical protein
MGLYCWLWEERTLNTMIQHRYCVRGGDIPVIFPGTLRDLEAALVFAIKTSQYLPDRTITVWLDRHEPKERAPIRWYKAGQELTNMQEAEED